MASSAPVYRRRSTVEIYLSILNAVKNGVEKPTHIMYASGLSHQSFRDKLEYLVKQGLLAVRVVEHGNSKARYSLTDKGLEVLRYLEKTNEIIPLINL